MKKRILKNSAAVVTALYIACTALTGCGKVDIPMKETPVTSATTSGSEAETTQTETVTVPPAVTEAVSSSAAKTDTKKTSKNKKSKSTKKTTATASTTTAATTSKAATAAVVTTVIPETTVTTTTSAETTTEPQTTTTTEAYLPEQIIPETVPNVETAAAVTESAETQTPITEYNRDCLPQSGRSHIIDLPCILQNPELPMGCEAVSLTMVFNYYGIYADKMAMANNYMPRDDVYIENGTMYGPDFRYTFAGDPADPKAYGCLAPCMMITAQNYINDVGGGVYPFDASGSSFEDLLTNYIDNDIPLLLWVTGDLVTPYYSHTWITPSGEQMYWLKYEHCLVLTGYDLDNGIVYVADPLVGNTAYSYDLVRQRYNELGQQSMGLMYF